MKQDCGEPDFTKVPAVYNVASLCKHVVPIYFPPFIRNATSTHSAMHRQTQCKSKRFYCLAQ